MCPANAQVQWPLVLSHEDTDETLHSLGNIVSHTVTAWVLLNTHNFTN